MFGRPMIVDDRGRRVPVFDLVKWPRGPHALAITAYTEEVQRVRWRERSLGLKALTLALALTPTAAIFASRPLAAALGLPSWMTLVLIPAAVAAVYWPLWRVQRAATVQIARGVMLRYGWCASCGYPLGGVEFAADGCRVCPECGAAWARS